MQYMPSRTLYHGPADRRQLNGLSTSSKPCASSMRALAVRVNSCQAAAGFRAASRASYMAAGRSLQRQNGGLHIQWPIVHSRQRELGLLIRALP